MAKSKSTRDGAKPQAAPIPVLDLTAEPVEDPVAAPDPAEDVKPADPPPPPPPPPPPRPAAPPPRRRSGAVYAVAALAVLAALAGAWLYREYGDGLWPSERARGVDAKIAALEAGQSTLTAQLKDIGATADLVLAREGEVKGLAEKSAGSSAAAVSTAEAAAARLAAMEAEAAALKSALADLDAKLAALQSAPPAGTGAAPPAAADTAELKALAARVQRLETQIAALPAQASEPRPGAQTAAALSQALADLKAKFALGAPYKPELDIIASLVPAAPGLDVLAQSAEAGIGNAEALAAQLRTLAAGLPTAAAAPAAAEEGGFWASLESALGSVVTVKTIGETDWRALALTAADVAQSGDLRLAIERLTAPGGSLPEPLQQWIAAAKTRIDATAALTVADAAVLRQIVSLGGQK